ncbi:MAG TPA: BatA domain-containing protein [Gemmatimonadales bacterium]|nr:BatA domain-containing protein [Gemmatimonadales bacterium]
MIGFLHPWVLAGLAAAAIPILLHLLARREPPTVVFPAVRYLVTTTREHQRRLKLQNWLLLLLRTLLIALLVLAAAGPTMPLSGVPGHSPSALALIVDNSPSSGAVLGGTPLLRQLTATAAQVLDRATPEDAVWLITADGIPRRGDRSALSDLLTGLTPSWRRLDIGSALTLAGQVLAAEPRPGEIVLLTDLQASAVSPAQIKVPLTIGRPDAPSPPNTGIAAIATGAQPWSAEGGRVVVALAGDSGTSVPVSAQLGNRPARQGLGHAGDAVSLAVPGAPGGWWVLTAELAADEFRADDRAMAAVRVAPVARVSWDSTNRFVDAAGRVLAANRRIVAGGEVTVGSLGHGISIVEPPEDQAQIGALNRALAARGVGWSFGDLVTQPGSSDSGAVVGRFRVLRRYALQSSGSGRTGVLATVGGAPWMVRGGNVVLLGSRMDPGWSDLPISAEFMPFMDMLINRLARGELELITSMPGATVALPDLVTDVREGERDWRVEGGELFQPNEPGVYYLLAGRDTVGAISVNLDPRESRLERASDRQVSQLWKGARLISLRNTAPLAFSSASRGDLRGPLLWMALAVGLMEAGLASGWRRRA